LSKSVCVHLTFDRSFPTTPNNTWFQSPFDVDMLPCRFLINKIFVLCKDILLAKENDTVEASNRLMSQASEEAKRQTATPVHIRDGAYA
jgi:hypothetical protein